jgi:hypothetical protein
MFHPSTGPEQYDKMKLKKEKKTFHLQGTANQASFYYNI